MIRQNLVSYLTITYRIYMFKAVNFCLPVAIPRQTQSASITPIQPSLSMLKYML